MLVWKYEDNRKEAEDGQFFKNVNSPSGAVEKWWNGSNERQEVVVVDEGLSEGFVEGRNNLRDQHYKPFFAVNELPLKIMPRFWCIVWDPQLVF